MTKILYSIDVNTGAFRETDVLHKNEIAVCRIGFTDKLTVTRFKTHKTLGELILIDRVTFMTSACGVVEEYDRSGGLTEDKITGRTRSACMGQQALTVVFSEEDGISKELLEEIEKKLILSGRHTYLLKEDGISNPEALQDVVRHLNAAGMVVLLFLRNGESVERIRDEAGTLIVYAVYAKEKKETDDIVAFVRKISSYEYDIAGDGLYI